MKRTGWLLFTACILAAGLLSAVSATGVRVVMKDGTLITGALAGMTDEEIFVETKKGKALTLKLEDVKAAFDAGTGKVLYPSAAAAAQQSAVEKEKDEGDEQAAEEKPQTKAALKSKAAAKEDEEEEGGGGNSQPKAYFELAAVGTLSDSYAVGQGLKDLTGSDMSSGSPAYWQLNGNFFFEVPDSAMQVGFGLGLTLPTSHSIWGSSIGFGSHSDTYFDPTILSFGIPLRYAFKDSGLSLTLQPDLLMGFVSGTYAPDSSVNVVVDNKKLTGPFYADPIGSMGVGFGLSVGAEYYFGMFGLGAKAGMRFLSTALLFTSSEVGDFSLQDPKTKQDVGVDLSGSYMTIGVMVKFGN